MTLIGKKIVMAVSGIVLFGFVFLHMAGNLKLYAGPEAYNHYAEWLRVMGAPVFPRGAALWLLRGGLIVAALAHIAAAWSVSRASRAARPMAYARYRRQAHATGYAVRTMRWGGVILALFVIYHLAHLTFGVSGVHPDFRPGDVYHNVTTGFAVWWVSAFYILAQVALGFHLHHGLWSLFQSLGWQQTRFDPWRRLLATGFAWIVTAANISFPLAVLAGVVS